MTYYEVTNDTTPREEWLAARKRFITASEVACILDVGFLSSSELAAQKKAAVVSEEDDKLGQIAFVAAGRHLESGVLSWFVAETPHLEWRTNRSLLARHDNPSLIAATPDGIIDDQPVDSKNVRFEAFSNWTKFGSRDEYVQHAWAADIQVANIVKRFPPITMKVAKQDWGTPRGEWRAAVVEAYQARLKLGPLQPPLKYAIQVLVQMYVMDAPTGWLTACFGGDTRIDFQLVRNPRLEAYWLSETARFIESIGGLNG